MMHPQMKNLPSYSSLENADYIILVFAGEHECNGNARISSQEDLGMAFHEVRMYVFSTLVS